MNQLLVAVVLVVGVVGVVGCEQKQEPIEVHIPQPYTEQVKISCPHEVTIDYMDDKTGFVEPFIKAGCTVVLTQNTPTR